MGRTINIELTDEQRAELEQGYRSGGTHVFRQRCHMVLLKAENRRSVDVAEILGVCAQTVNGWLWRYKQAGLKGLTQQLAREHLPKSVTLCDLGQHRLKDLLQPDRIFELLVDGLPTDFPPLKTLDRRRHNLPIQRSPLIGREREVASVVSLLRRPEIGLVTLTGPGGTGKTRLALQVAADLLDEFPDGVIFVNLAPLSDPALVVATIAQTLNVTEAGGQPLLETVQAYLRDKTVLLLLDNFEQVVGAAPVVAALLQAAPRLKALVTSRVVLRLSGEHEYTVPPLTLPDPKRLPPLEHLRQYEAVRLFIERAQAAKADFVVTNVNAPAVAEICVRLDGVPLALELAAARSKMLAPEALLARLTNRLKLLTGGARDLPARHQTLRNAIDWSYDLLEPVEQTLFARLAVFVGGCTLEAIEAVCNADGDLPIDVFGGISSLLDKSLLRQEEGPEGEPRLMMLESIHEYAREWLQASGEAEVLQRQHAEYFLALAEQAVPELEGLQQGTWLERLEADHDNLRTALQWALEREEPEPAVRLSGALGRFWMFRGHLTEGRRWLELALRRGGQLVSPAAGWALAMAGELASLQSDFRCATAFQEKALTIYRALGDMPGVAHLLHDLGNLAADQGNLRRGMTLHEDALALRREQGAIWSIAHSLSAVGYMAMLQGDYGRGEALLEESVGLWRHLRQPGRLADALETLGNAAIERTHYVRARVLLEESLTLYQQLSIPMGIAFCLAAFAALAAETGYPEQAARLWGAAEVLRDTHSIALAPVVRARYEWRLASAQSHLDAPQWEVAWAEGRAMSLEQVIAYALEPMPQELPGPAPSLLARAVPPAGLTEREVEVLRLVAQGLSDQKVADNLIVSRRTVSNHLRSIYGKLQVTSRAGATRLAVEHGLV